MKLLLDMNCPLSGLQFFTLMGLSVFTGQLLEIFERMTRNCSIGRLKTDLSF
jgi:hypothetical protein